MTKTDTEYEDKFDTKAPLDPKFKVGDVIQLKSGGPSMSVSEVFRCVANPYYRKVICRWFTIDGELRQDAFNEDVLQKWLGEV